MPCILNMDFTGGALYLEAAFLMASTIVCLGDAGEGKQGCFSEL